MGGNRRGSKHRILRSLKNQTRTSVQKICILHDTDMPDHCGDRKARHTRGVSLASRGATIATADGCCGTGRQTDQPICMSRQICRWLRRETPSRERPRLPPSCKVRAAARGEHACREATSWQRIHFASCTGGVVCRSTADHRERSGRRGNNQPFSARQLIITVITSLLASGR